MKFVNMDGNEIKREDFPDMDTGRFLQSETDPDAYVFSPWATVPPRDEETVPDAYK